MAKTDLNLNNDTAVTNRNRFLELVELYADTSSLIPKRTSIEQTEVENLQDMFDDDGNLLTAEEAEQALDATTETIGALQTFTDNTFNPSADSVGWAQRSTRTFDGQTLINLLGEIGAFLKDSNSDGLADNWTANNSGSLSLSNGIQSFAPIAQNGDITTTDTVSLTGSHTYYACADVNSDNTSTRLVFAGVTNAHGGSGGFERLSIRLTVGSSIDTTVQIDNQLSSSWTEIQVKNVMLIDLTQMYGSGNEPTQAQMDLVPYFSNSRHFGERVRSVGKNLLTNFILGSLNSNGEITPSTNLIISDFALVKPSESYTTSVQSTDYVISATAFYDANKNLILFAPSSGTTPSNAKFVIVRWRRSDSGTIDLDEANVAQPMFEHNSNNTDFEEYNERNMFVPKIRSVGDGTNTVEDSIEDNIIIRKTINDFNNFVKNSQSTDWQSSSPLTNTIAFFTTIRDLLTSNLSSNINSGYLRIGNKTILFNETSSTGSSDVEFGRITTSQNGLLIFRISQSFASNVSELISQLQANDVELVFESPQSYTEDANISGNLYAFPDGQIQNEGIVPVVSISAQFPESQASASIANTETNDSNASTVDRIAMLNKVHDAVGVDAYEITALDNIELQNQDQLTIRFGVPNTGASTINNIDVFTTSGETVNSRELNGVEFLEYRRSGDHEAFYLTI